MIELREENLTEILDLEFEKLMVVVVAVAALVWLNAGSDRCVRRDSVCFEGTICIVWVGVGALQRCARNRICFRDRTRLS